MVLDKFRPKVIRKVCDVMFQWCRLAATFHPWDKVMPVHFAHVAIFSRYPFFAGVDLVICLPFDPFLLWVANTTAKDRFF